jgi:hypothetical protein
LDVLIKLWLEVGYKQGMALNPVSVLTRVFRADWRALNRGYLQSGVVLKSDETRCNSVLKAALVDRLIGSTATGDIMQLMN